MVRAAPRFVGSHNFTNFARVGDKNPERNILSACIAEEEGFVFFEVTAESFLWHQVRCMAEALLRIGHNEAPEESITRMLSGPAERPLQPAPAEGLILWDTDCGISWTQIPSRERSSRFIDHLRTHHALMEKICRTLNGPGTS